jgi:phosphoglycerate dehydrogenase-like enzyme
LLGIARKPRKIEPFEAVQGLDQLTSLVERSDYVLNLLPEGAETRGLFDLAVFSRFKPGATFINVGRGSAVVEVDLVQALNTGLLCEAVLDVCQCEPLTEDSPLWSTAGIVLTAHTAAPSAPHAVSELFKANLAKFLAGEDLIGAVDLR